MSTWDSFVEERKASSSDIAQEIRESVTMDEALAMYSPSTPRRNRRCPCPIHNGKDYNFSYAERGYNCFVCGASGDVIGFVKEVCELATRSDAMQRINRDFRLNLPINGTLSTIQSANFALRRKEAKEKERAKKQWWTEYQRLLDKFILYDKALRESAPDSQEYAEAARNVDFCCHQLDSLPQEPR